MADVTSTLDIRFNEQHIEATRKNMERIAAESARARQEATNTGAAWKQSFRDADKDAAEFWRHFEQGNRTAQGRSPGLTTPVAPSGITQRLERMLGIDPTVVLGESAAEKRQLNAILARRETLQRYAGGGGARLGLAGAAMYGGSKIMGAYAQAVQAGVGLEAGELSGSLTGALSGESGYRRQMRGAALGAGQGVAYTAAAGMALYGGLPGMVAGAGIALVTAIASPIIDAYVQKTQVREAAAIGTMEKFMSRRGALAGQEMGLLSIGGGLTPESAMRFTAGRYGVGAQQQLAMRQAYLRGGKGAAAGAFNADTLAALNLGFGLDAGSVGGLYAGTSAGQGAKLAGGSERAYLEGVLAQGMAAGIEKARLPDFLARVASSNESLAQYGGAKDIARVSAVATGLTRAGMQGFQAQTFQAGAEKAGTNALFGINEMIMPGAARDALIKRWAFQKFGAAGATAGLENTMNAGGMPEALKGIAQGLGNPMMSTAFLTGSVGMFPGASRKALGLEVGGVGTTDVEAEAERVKREGGERFGAVAAQATLDTMQTFAGTLKELDGYFKETIKQMGVNIENMHNVALELMEKHRAELAPPVIGHSQDTFEGRARVSQWGGARH